MFDLRYHVASLAAVFIALILGIVVGVGLSGSGVTKEADLRIARDQRDAARSALEDARTQLRQADKMEQAFHGAYPALVQDRLRGKRIALLFVGPVDKKIQDSVDQTLTDAGAAPVLRMRAIVVPINVAQIDSTLLASGPGSVQYIGDDKLSQLGRALAREFAQGGETPLWTALSRRLVEERSGSVRKPVDGVVVFRNADPQQGATAAFLAGLYDGLSSAGIPAVGVEKTGATRSAISTYSDRGLSSVDDLDLPSGRVALVWLLAGARDGHYGVKRTAEDVLPPVDSLPPLSA